MELRNFVKPTRDQLDRLHRLRLFSSEAPAFWAQFTEVAQEMTGASQARSIVRLDGTWNLLAASPSAGVNHRAFLQQDLEAQAALALESGRGVVAPAESKTGALHVLQALQTEATSTACLLELRFVSGEQPAPEAEIWSSLLPLLADTPRIYQKNRAAVEMRQDVDRMREALDVLAVVNGHNKFAPASMALVNEVTSRLEAERACLGWVKSPYVRVVAVSGTEKFERKMEILQDLEAAMEECRDQDEELVWPASSNSSAICHDHDVYSRKSESACLLSVPIRNGNEVVGVLTVERPSPPFTESEAWGLRVVGDQIAPRLTDLKEKSRWFGARWAASVREQLAKALSPKHTWLKFAAIVTSAILLFSILVPFTYRVSATFIIRPDSLAHLPAPYEGFIAQAGVRPGDLVVNGQTLLALDDRDLTIQRAETMAEIRRHRANAELAEAEGNLAELRVSRAQQSQAEARLDFLEYQLGRSEVKAPFDGVVVQGDLRERIGAPVQQGEVLLQVSKLDGLYVEIRLPERDIDLIGQHRSGLIVFSSRPDLQFPVEVEMISPAATPEGEGNMFILRARLLEEADWLRPGMSGVARLDGGDRTLAWRATHRIVDFIRMRVWF
ncbi:MAG: HlyD family efflux transporter periplasmic adaptor subunit [Puniceicoccaceae bacterium]|nr:MAG: HlyD family efflux transporter periplasmic adaptor subunit [Puniceicoccaceae bacterium]